MSKPDEQKRTDPVADFYRRQREGERPNPLLQKPPPNPFEPRREGGDGQPDQHS